MKQIIKIIIACFLSLALISSIVSAHVPYIEYKDYNEDKPLYVWKMIEYSKAFYAWLENDGVNPCEDIDAFKFNIINKPKHVYIELIVPVVDDYYEEFVPWFALVGPELPEPNQNFPFEIPPGYGVIVKENVEPGTERETLYEPFGGKSYYVGPIFEENLSEPGTYYIYCWDPYEQGGDYVLVLGKGEFFGPIDIIRSIINTIIIRRDGELHIN
ncbi:MAG: hypothetical protein JSV67_04385 [Thermoplasmatales archaeon]|nr:MAG: hypothetical protein JSV67_04385 [Thermoplasmatales archaeon]